MPDLSTHQQRILDRVTDRAGADNNWVRATRIGAISTLEQLVARGYLVPRVVHTPKGAEHYYRLKREEA